MSGYEIAAFTNTALGKFRSIKLPFVIACLHVLQRLKCNTWN